MDTKLDLIWRDPDYVAVYKPADLLVHRSPIDRHETRFLVQELRNQLGTRVYPVHRLDKPTAGVMVFALSSEAASRLAPAFAGDGVEKSVRKHYQAVVRGRLEGEGLIDYAFAPRADERARGGRDGAERRPASTAWRVLETCVVGRPVGRYDTARFTRLALRPLTGRKHQLRRHMKHVFHPILGDTTYGDGAQNRLLRDLVGVNRLMLVATGLEFSHPASGESVSLTVRPDTSWRDICDAMGLGGHRDGCALRPVRTATETTDLLRLWREYFASVSVDLGFQNNARDLSDPAAVYAEPAGRLIAAWSGVEMVACVALRPVGDGICEMQRLYVRPAARGRGLGRRLAEHIIGEAGKAGYRRICLDVLPEFHAARRLYEALGFRDAPPVAHNPVPGTRFLGLDL
ncbi:MAG: GNAT family N-acetyltransferase [Gammaproteobacteria bacterium]